MRRLVAILTITCLAYALAGTLPAEAATDLSGPVSGSFVGPIDPVTSRLCPAGSAQEMPYQPDSGGPAVLRLGLCQATYQSTEPIGDGCYVYYHYTVTGAFEAVTADGDVVRGDVSGTYTQQTSCAGKESYAADVTLTVRSGTGAYEHASGTVAVSAGWYFGGQTNGHAGHTSGTLAGSVTSPK